MNQIQKQKLFNALSPQAIVNNASFTTNVVDCLGFARLTLVIMLGATDIAFTAMKAQESDAITNATTLNGGVDITNSIVGTAANLAGVTSALPTATDDNNIFVLEFDLRPRKRYIKPVVTVGNGSTGGFATILAILTPGATTPTTTAARGAAQILNAMA